LKEHIKKSSLHRTKKKMDKKKEYNEVMHEEYPPYESVVITHKGTQVIASPIKRASLSDEKTKIPKI
jgi:hypothetical protein